MTAAACRSCGCDRTRITPPLLATKGSAATLAARPAGARRPLELLETPLLLRQERAQRLDAGADGGELGLGAAHSGIVAPPLAARALAARALAVALPVTGGAGDHLVEHAPVGSLVLGGEHERRLAPAAGLRSPDVGRQHRLLEVWDPLPQRVGEGRLAGL